MEDPSIFGHGNIDTCLERNNHILLNDSDRVNDSPLYDLTGEVIYNPVYDGEVNDNLGTTQQCVMCRNHQPNWHFQVPWYHTILTILLAKRVFPPTGKEERETALCRRPKPQLRRTPLRVDTGLSPNSNPETRKISPRPTAVITPRGSRCFSNASQSPLSSRRRRLQLGVPPGQARGLDAGVLLVVVGDGRLDGILGKHAAVELDWWQALQDQLARSLIRKRI